MREQLTEEDLKKALQCADWVSFYKNSMAKETHDIILKLVDEIHILRHNAKTDAEYTSTLLTRERYRQEADAQSYQCGEL